MLPQTPEELPLNDGEKCTTKGRPYVIGHNQETMTAVCFMPNCGMWTCEYCSQQRAVEWRMTAWHGSSDLMARGELLQFLTVTSRGGKGRTRERSLEQIARAWPRLVARLKYERGAKPEYIVVPEQHKNGVVHLHAIITAQWSKHDWHNAAYKSGFGYQAEPRNMEDAVQAPAYVSKYLGKDFAAVKWPANFRRVRASQGWPKIEKPDKVSGVAYDAFISMAGAWAQIYLLRDGGYDVTIKDSAKRGLLL